MADKEVKVILTSDDRMSPGMKSAAASTKALQTAVAGGGPGFLKMSSAMAAGSLAAGAIAKGAEVAAGAILGTVKAAGTYEQSMNVFQAVSGAANDQMAAVRSTAIALGKDLTLPATSSADAGRAMTELAKSGLSVDQAMAAAKGTLQLAAAATIDEGTAAKITGAALNAFGLEGSNATRIADMLATASNISAAEITDLGSGIQQAGFAFKATGRPVEELIGSLALLTNAGLTGSDAGTALKNALIRMVDPTNEAKKVMKEYGITLFDANGNLKPLPAIVDTLNQGLSGLTPEAKNAALSTMFLSDGWKALQPLLDQGGDKLQKTIEQLGKQGTAAELAAAKTKGTLGAWSGLESQLETLQTTLGTKVGPAFASAATLAAEAVGEINTAVEGMDFAPAFAQADTFKTNVSNAFYSAGVAVANFADTELAKIPGRVGEVEQILGNVAGSVLVGLAAALRGDVAGAMAAFTQAWKDLDAAIRLAQSLMGGFKFPTLTQTILEVAAAIGDVGDILATSGALWAAWSRGVVLSVTAVREIFTLDWKQAAATLDRAAEQFALGFTLIGENAARSAQRWRTARQSFVADADTMDRDMGVAMRNVAANADKSFDSAAQAAKRYQAGLTASLGAAADAIDRDYGQALQETFGGLPPIIETAGTAMEASAQATYAQLLATAISGGAEIAAAAGVAGTDATTQFAAGIEPLDDEAAAAVAAAIAIVNAEAGAAGAAGSNVGSAMADGISGALDARAGQVAEAAGSIVRDAIVRMRSEAETASPSRKTAAIGEDMWAGLNNALAAGKIDESMFEQIRGYAGALQAQLPYLGEIGRVEGEIKTIREDAATSAMFRSIEMIDAESELLRLKRDMANAEYALVPARQAAASAAREAQAIERGSIGDRTRLIELDNQQAQLRLKELDIREKLAGLSAKDKRREQLQAELDALRKQGDALSIQADRIGLVNKIQASGARIAAESAKDQVEQSERAQQGTRDQIEVLNALESVFRANEAVIKNATDNEVQYRERLIAVFRSESKPLQERITAGLGLIQQLENEGQISEELANKLRALSASTIGNSAATATMASVASAAKGNTQGLGNAAQSAAGQFDQLADKIDDAGDELSDYLDDLEKYSGGDGKNKTKKGSSSKFSSGSGAENFDYTQFTPEDFGGSAEGFASGGYPPVGVPSWVGERGKELIVPLVPSRVLDNTSSMAALGGGGPVINNNLYQRIEGSVLSEGQLMALVERGFRLKSDRNLTSNLV